MPCTALPQSTLEKAESLEQLRWLENGYRIGVGITDVETIGIDTPQDLARAEEFLCTPSGIYKMTAMKFIAGPCVIESAELLDTVAERLVAINKALGTDIIFKASFDKANRTSISSFRGPGLEQGLRMLADVRAKWGLRLLTDIHEAWQAAPVGEVVDVIQIPAFLCRQTDLLTAAARTGKTGEYQKGAVPFGVGHAVPL